MELGMEKCITAIDSYLAREDSTPRLVNIDHPDQMNRLISHYQVGENRFLTVSRYSKPDEKAQTDALLHDLVVLDGNLFVVGFTTFWKFEGETELKKRLNSLLHLTVKGHLIVLCYQCKKFLWFEDLRLDRLIYIVNDGVRALQPEICFCGEGIPIPCGAEVARGIHTMSEAIETKVLDCLAVKTRKSRTAFPYSMFKIMQEKSPYDVLCRIDPLTRSLEEKWGTASQWKYALQLFDSEKSWIDVFQKEFNVTANFDLLIQVLTGNSDNTDWLYFIALKLLGASNSLYLQNIVNKSNSFEQLVDGIIQDLLNYEPSDKKFWKVYEERLNLMKSVEISESLLFNYCQIVPVKREKGIYYLTDRSDEEVATLLRLLAQYECEYERDSLRDILLHINPHLAAYLNAYDFKNDLLNQYFTQYTWQKITNHINPDFEKIVEDQAEKREYNAILAPRASCIENIPRKKTYAYFVDAMGVEFLGYIVERCQQLDLVASIQICRAEIPTLTAQNKEFLEYFVQNDIAYSNVKDLDDYKHSGENDYNYSLSKLPLHLPKELEVINRILLRARTYLCREQFEQIVLIADHGSSRLAVIREKDLTVDVNSKGTHGGRVCSFSDDVTGITKALASDDQKYYVIANYDRFKGSRRPSVETHGGATLEELTVPIIVLTVMPRGIEVIIETPIVQASFKNPAIIRFYSKTKLSKIGVEIMGKRYPVTVIDDHSFSITMDKKAKKGLYKATVFSADDAVASNLEFRIEKAGIKMKDIL